MNSRIVYIIFLVFIYAINTFSQNLVIDGGFENITLSIVDEKEFYNYNKWISLTPIDHITRNGAPFFPEYIKRSKNKGSKKIAYYTPFEGNSYLTCIVANVRNLHQGRLIKPIKAGCIYKISFNLKVISDYYSKNKVEKSINGKIGVWFTTKSLNDSISRKVLMNPKIKLIPSVVVDSYSYNCEEQWISFSEVWKADKDYKYIIVGNFEKIISGNEIGYHIIKGVTYRIDNLKVEKLLDNKKYIIGKEIISDCVNDDSESIEYDIFKTPVFENNVTIDENLRSYYKIIHEAEQAIIESNYLQASHLYLEAFKYRKPFFKDYFNLKNILKLDTLVNKEMIQILAAKKYRFNPEDTMLYNKIDSIFSLDQASRNSNNSIKTQDSLNNVFLVKLYSKKTKLNERTIGANGITKLITILLHLSRYKSFDKLDEYLFQATLDGDFRNRDFAFLVDSYVKNNSILDKSQSYYCTDCAIPIFSKFIIPPIDSLSLIKYNNNRKSIYLEQVNEQFNKQYYNFKNGYELVNFYEIISMFPTEKSIPESQKHKFLNQENKIIEELKQKYGKIEIR
jgi:hypothetical protein